MSCEHEHHERGHGHNENDHLPPPNTSQAQSLYQYIDFDRVRVANVVHHDNATRVIRPNEDYLDETPILESDVDEEVIVVIPFIGSVKLHSVLMRAYGDESSPQTINLFKDMPQLDFDTAATTPVVQSLEFPEGVGLGVTTSEGNDGIVQFAVNRPKFSNMNSLTIHIHTNYGAERTKVVYIGLRGEYSELRRVPLIATYEAAANPKDHNFPIKELHLNARDLE